MNAPDFAKPSVAVSSVNVSRLLGNAASVAPHECCGLFYGHVDCDENFRIDSIQNVPNSSPSNRCYDFAIAPDDLAKSNARHRDRQLIGFFHSHPNGIAKPSAKDVEFASPWPGYLHAIIAPKNAADRGHVAFFMTHQNAWTQIALRKEDHHG